MHPYIRFLGLLCTISHHQEIREVRRGVWQAVYDAAVHNLWGTDDESARRNKDYLEQTWAQLQDYYNEMIYDRVAGSTWTNPLYNYNPSAVTTANAKLCHVLVALNELRILATSARHGLMETTGAHEDMDTLMAFASHVLELLSPDKPRLLEPPC